MKKIKDWKVSASESWSQNEKSVKKNCVLYFFVTVEEKEYLEKHTNEIDEWCGSTIGEIPHTIRFQEDWDEYNNETSFICECYFDNGGIEVQSCVDTVEGMMDVYTKKDNGLKVGVKKYLNGDYSKNGNEIELYTIEDDWQPKFYIKISSKDGSEITDDIIKSHVQIFYDVTEGKDMKKIILKGNMPQDAGFYAVSYEDENIVFSVTNNIKGKTEKVTIKTEDELIEKLLSTKYYGDAETIERMVKRFNEHSWCFVKALGIGGAGICIHYKQRLNIC